jgi:hypothetical protein
MSNEPLQVPVINTSPVFKSTDMFYVWYDDTPHKQTTVKLDEAIDAYISRFAMRPSHVLVNSADIVGRTDLIVSSGRTVQPNSFWLSNEKAVVASTR